MLKKIIKKYWWIIAIIIAFPIIVNMCYCIKTTCDVLHEPKEWTKFWGTYISGIASCGMLVLTYTTLKLTISESEPQVYFDIVKASETNSFNLVLKNIGKSIAKDVSITVELNSKMKKKHSDLKENAISNLYIYPFEKVEVLFLKYKHKDTQMSYIWGNIKETKVYEEIVQGEIMNIDSYITITCKYGGKENKRKISLTDVLNNEIKYTRI